MYLAGRNQPLSHLSLQKGFAVLKEAGAEAVELCHEHPQMAPDRMSPQFADRIAAMLADAGLRASAVGWHCDYIDSRENFGKLQRLVELTPRFGTDVFITACVGPERDHDAPDRMVRRTRTLAQLAREVGVRLAVEYEPGFLVGDSAALTDLFQLVGSDALAANLDVGHAFLVEDEPLEAIRRLGDRIVHCHVEGMGADAHKHLLPWQGDLPLPAYLHALRKAGFDGALALDLYGVDYAAVAPQCFRYLQRLLDEL